jgi:hypothetical protein
VGVWPVGLALRRGGAALLGDRRRMHAHRMRQRVGSTLIRLPLILGELFGGAVGREAAADRGAGWNTRTFARRPLLPGRLWGVSGFSGVRWGAGATLAYGLARPSGSAP